MSTCSSAQKLRISSSSSARFVAITNARSLPCSEFIRLASAVIQRTSGKFSSGSPPWNSIFRCGDGDLKASSSARRAVCSVMSNSFFAADCRDTWQYRHVCSQRSVTTKMCSPVESGRRRIRVRSLMASSSAGSVSPGT